MQQVRLEPHTAAACSNVSVTVSVSVSAPLSLGLAKSATCSWQTKMAAPFVTAKMAYKIALHCGDSFLRIIDSA